MSTEIKVGGWTLIENVWGMPGRMVTAALCGDTDISFITLPTISTVSLLCSIKKNKIIIIIVLRSHLFDWSLWIYNVPFWACFSL